VSSDGPIDDQADREALGRLKRGDPSGFDLAYDRHRDRVYAFLFRLTGRADLADDLFQETLTCLASSAQ